MIKESISVVSEPELAIPTQSQELYRSFTVSDQIYRPCPPTVSALDPGYYHTGFDNNGLYFGKLTVEIRDLILFKGSVVERIVKEFNNFWVKKERYLSFGEPHKRGFLLWGPPGGGKTCAVSLLINEFIKQGNIVFKFSLEFAVGFDSFRKIEPNRKVMVIIEDIELFLQYADAEQRLLQFLDGDRQFSNTVIIATTNYPEKLGDRIINRPSRFDTVYYLGMPTVEERKEYLTYKCKITSTKEITKWSKDTDGWTLAHLKELITAVEVLEYPYETVITRINKMREKKSHSDAYQAELRGTSSIDFGFNRGKETC
ncbi:MAG TPA: AAA family ATPase [Bacteroidales bacterium]|nr:AAA family ATPase [Bacteroidales bacterium]